MLIRSISVENFLPFQGKQRIDFSTDSERNVTLIMGDNGAGKTSLAQAFEWCLYGRAPKDSQRVINAYVRDRIPPGSYRYAAVEIILEKNGTIFEVSRRQQYSRRKTGTLERPGKHEFNIVYRERGETKPVDPVDRQATINMLLSGELSHYFFFDGEHVKNMRTEIEKGKSSDFADAVKTILGLQPIASAREHLRPTGQGNKPSVRRWFNRQLDDAGDALIKGKKKEADELEDVKIPEMERELELAKKDEAAANESVEQFRQQLRDNKESEEAQKAVEKIEKDLQKAKKAYEQRRNEFLKLFRKQHYRFFVERSVEDAKEVLADEDKISKGIPSVDDKTIYFILNRGECICGTKFSEGDDICQHLRDLLQYVPPKDLGTYISEFDKECRLRTEGTSSFYQDLVEAFQEFSLSEKAIPDTEKKLSKAVEYLENLKSVDVEEIREKLAEAEKDRRNASGRVQAAKHSIANMTSKAKFLRNEVAANSVKSKKNEEIRECLRYVDYIYDFLDKFYTAQETKTRERLNSTVNKFFSEMYNGQLHLELDKNYGVTVVVDDVNTEGEIWKTSSGQTLAIILAFILGILDIAKDSISNGSELLKGDTYPLVMDAPLSDFDKTRIGTICRLLPVVAEQVIIIIKDTDGELAEEHMSSRIGRRYTIERIRDYESVVKE